MASNLLFNSSQFQLYHGDACDILPQLDLSRMFCFCAPPPGQCVELLKRCEAAAVYCASPEIFREYWRPGWRQIIAEHRSLMTSRPEGSNIFTNIITTSSLGMDVWFDCSLRRLDPNAEPGAYFAGRVLRELCQSSVVIDPFAGCGGTVTAALESGRKAIAIENDRERCDFLLTLVQSL